MNKLIHLSFLFTFILLVQSQTFTFFCDPAVKVYDLTCGDVIEPCPDIFTALLAYSKVESDSTNLILNLGTGVVYSGANNTNLSIFNRNISIIGSSSIHKTTIDLQNNGNFITISDANSKDANPSTVLNIKNLNIINGLNNFGGVFTLSLQSDFSVELNINASTFNMNHAVNGGVIDIISMSPKTVINIGYSYFANNTAEQGAAICTSTMNSLTISNTYFIQNSADNDAIIYSLSNNIVLNSVTMTNNVANTNIVSLSSNPISQFTNLNFNNNNLREQGSFILSNQNIKTIFTNSTFYNNNGGSIIEFNYEMGTLTVADSTFNTNNGALRGGALKLGQASSLVLTNTNFGGNQVISQGGAIYLNITNIVTLTDVWFDANLVAQGGSASAIYIKQSFGNVNLTNVQFTNNGLSSSIKPIFCSSASLILNSITGDAGSNLVQCSDGGSCNITGTSSQGMCAPTTTGPATTSAATTSTTGPATTAAATTSTTGSATTATTSTTDPATTSTGTTSTTGPATTTAATTSTTGPDTTSTSTTSTTGPATTATTSTTGPATTSTSTTSTTGPATTATTSTTGPATTSTTSTTGSATTATTSTTGPATTSTSTTSTTGPATTATSSTTGTATTSTTSTTGPATTATSSTTGTATTSTSTTSTTGPATTATTSGTTDTTTTSTTGGNHDDKHKKKLSGGAIAGIIFGVFAGVGVLGLAGYIYYKRSKRMHYLPINQ